MACYHPIRGYRKKHPNPSGKYGFTINPRDGSTRHEMTIPCGYCIGCRLEKSRQWAVRCVHEASLHQRNCFITLTFNNKSLKERGTQSLRKRDFQLFMKKLRKKYGEKIRYFHCGEYGENKGRPHYHAILFGHDFPDKKPWKKNLWRSPSLEKLWPYGYSSIGTVTFESAAYVARYVVKKRYGKDAPSHYEKIDFSTGEVEQLQPEYTTMSRRPGIASEWFAKYQNDVYPKDMFHIRGKQCRPTRYYDKLYESTAPDTYRKIKLKRKRKQKLKELDKQQPSLDSQKAVAMAKLNLKTRRLE